MTTLLIVMFKLIVLIWLCSHLLPKLFFANVDCFIPSYMKMKFNILTYDMWIVQNNYDNIDYKP